VQALRKLLADFRSRPRAHLAVVSLALVYQAGFVAAAASPTILAVPALGTQKTACTVETCAGGTMAPPSSRDELALPDGMRHCGASGPAAACASAASPAGRAPGTASVPAGQTSCGQASGKTVPSTPAACSDAVLPPVAPAGAGTAEVPDPVVVPSVPLASLGQRTPARLTLDTSASTERAGATALLTATASATVSGTRNAIEIFDLSAGSLVGACASGSQCTVGYSAPAGVHRFAAYITPPSPAAPDASIAVASNEVSVGWLGTGIRASESVVGQGQRVTITATSTFDVRGTGRWLEIYDRTAGSRVTYCSQGTSCTTTLKETTGGTHELVGYVNGRPEAVSDPIDVTWIDVSLSATSIGPKTGGTVFLKATTNAALDNTPWVVGVYDQQGRLVDHACKTGNTCSVRAWMSDGTVPKYTAMVGTLAETNPTVLGKAIHAVTTTNLVDVKARSRSVEPTHLLWGVDSCKAFIGTAEGGNLYGAVVKRLGTPDFWGRYLTNTVCPGISARETALAHAQGMGILPIYNDYNCSNVSYYATGHQYAVEAVAAAQRIGISPGRVIAIDIEPYGAACPGAGSVDSGFIEGWFDGISDAGYIPVYYGNGTRGSEFARAWCAAVSTLPNIATGSDLWSFQPSLLGRFAKNHAPNYAPYDTSCAGNILAWQYVLSAGGYPDVDQDEAISSLPLWYP
jgi:Rv2525c-like, glycoside hydrolase-like domain